MNQTKAPQKKSMEDRFDEAPHTARGYAFWNDDLDSFIEQYAKERKWSKAVALRDLVIRGVKTV